MRNVRRFWNREVAKCETLVAFGIVKLQNARLSSLLESCSCKMPDSRRFWNRAVAKCETLVAFGIVKLRNARLSSLLES